MSSSQRPATKELILQTAERLFAENGYAGVSLRQIIATAGVNLAALNYHFYDKEGLFREILTRRMREINQRRLALLDQAEARSGGQPPLAEIIDILARPLLEPGKDPRHYNAHSARLLGRILSEPYPGQAALLNTEFQPAMQRLGQAVRRHLPSLPPADFLWRFSLVAGALHHSMATLHDMHSLTRGICADADFSGALHSYRKFALQALG